MIKATTSSGLGLKKKSFTASTKESLNPLRLTWNSLIHRQRMTFFQTRQRLIKYLVIFSLTSGLMWAFINRYHYFLWATFNEYYVRKEFTLPDPGKELIIRNEEVGLPLALKRIIDFAFPEYKIIYKNDTLSPHLIITGYYGQPEEAFAQQHIQAPYFTLSAENKSVRWRRFRATGYPFAEFVGRKKQTDNFIFLPFLVYAYPSLKEILLRSIEIRAKNTTREKHVAYIASDCTPEREGIFHALKAKLGADQAIGMGRCSTTPGHRAPGGYGDLDMILSHYNFVIAAENRNYPGYVTEKIINAYKVGAIPIYWGNAETMRAFFNADSFIDATHFASFEDLAEEVNRLINTPQELEKKLKAPLFKDHKIPSFLLINEEKLTPEAEKILREMGRHFRRLYDDYVDKRRRRKPYTKALDWSWESLA